MNSSNYLRLIFAVFATKVLVACFFPLLSDEALHILWGFDPSYGYSDHAAMTGWFSYISTWLGHNPLAYRMSCLVTVFVVTEGIRRFLTPYGADRARLIAAIYTLTPLNFFHLVFTPETPLLLFTFLAAMAILKASAKNSAAWALVAGLLQSAAIVSKYNGIWFGAAAFFFFVLRPQSRSLKLTLAYGLGCLPSFALIGLYNYNHCWINWSRASSRMAGKEFFVMGPVAALAYQLYAASPWTWIAFFKRDQRRADFTSFRAVLPYFFWIPMACLFYVSLQNKVGAHWMQSFYPFFFLLLVEAREKILQICLRLNVAFVAVHLALIGGLMAIPIEWIGAKSPRYHHDVVMAFRPTEFCEAFQKFAGEEAALATFDYSQSSTLWVNCLTPMLRYGYGALDGRDFDRMVDYRSYDGRMMAVVWQKEFNSDKLRGGLLEPRFGTFSVHGKLFYAAVGRFSFESYKESVLSEQLQNIYDPAGRNLPNEACYFKRRYFPELFN